MIVYKVAVYLFCCMVLTLILLICLTLFRHLFTINL